MSSKSKDPTEYEVVIKASLFSTLGKDELQRELVIALWEGMDESVLIPDGATDELRIIEYTGTDVQEVL